MGGITTIINKVKYIGIASLTIAILSVLTLNIISSYSSSNTNSNAEPATQANGPLVSGPATISLSITSLTTPTSSPCDTSNSNICMKIPDDGGIATGGHTVEVSSNSYAGYNVLLSAKESNNDETSLVNTTNGSSGGSNSYSIPTTTGNLSAPSKLDNNTWGYVLTNPTGQETNAIWAGLQPSTNKTAIATTGSLSNQTDSYPVYYGVKVDNPNELLAGDYQTQVVYTATVKLPSKPTITSITPDSYELDSGTSGQVTITGTNLGSTYSVYIANANGDRVGDCANLSVTSDTSLTCDIFTTGISAGDYTIHVVTQGGGATIGFTYIEAAKKLSVYDSAANVRVDYDANMIPVKYVGYDGDGGGHWAVVTDAEIEQSVNNWFKYDATEKRWANAITVTADSRDKYRKKQAGEDPDASIVSDNNPEILGYWAYIPRYAYEVMRRDATDRVVSIQNFDIRFETTDDVKKTPAKGCTTSDMLVANLNSAKDYRTQCGISRTYGAATGTTWATHPAFSWLDSDGRGEELNGFWFGKFETTGKKSAPTVKPNQHAQAGEYIGEYYNAAKSIGVVDAKNTGGGADDDDTTPSVVQNTHNLTVGTSHMVNNSEWGAVLYLAHSQYGAGVNTGYSRKSNVQANAAYSNDSTKADADGDVASGDGGITGCGPDTMGSTKGYVAGTLTSSTIESLTACGGNVAKAYNGSYGVTASTTNNIYGVYDMFEGAQEYIVGSRSDDIRLSATNERFTNAATAPYVDIYSSQQGFGSPVAWSARNKVNSTSSEEYYFNFDVCTFEICGGSATHETAKYQSSPGSNDADAWDGSDANFATYPNGPWFIRGGEAKLGNSGPFYVQIGFGNTSNTGSIVTYRIALITG